MERIRDREIFEVTKLKLIRDFLQWKRAPENTYVIDRINAQIGRTKGYNLTVSVGWEACDLRNRESAYIPRTMIEAYGKNGKKGFSFSSKDKVKFHASSLEEAGYMFFERDGRIIGFCRPEYIKGIKLTKR